MNSGHHVSADAMPKRTCQQSEQAEQQPGEGVSEARLNAPSLREPRRQRASLQRE